MKKIKNFFGKSLYIELAILVVFAILAGIGANWLLQILNMKISYSKWASTDYKDTVLENYTVSIQEFIDKNNISSEDTSVFTEWADENLSLFFYIKKDNYIIYNSFYYYPEGQPVDKIPVDDNEFWNEISDYSEFFPEITKKHIYLVDGEALLYLYSDVQFGLYSQLQNVCLILSALITIIIIIVFIRLKIHYIKDITSGIHILEGGNLSYQVPEKGNDELSSVAKSLNSMRIALSQQMENEKKALQANNSLVTALSHDLRTPLTTQMGYLEILKEHHYNSPEEMDKYINTALDTCNQIKDMSDRLFEYFLAFDPDPKRPDEALEEYNGAELFMQLFGELSLPLINAGFNFNFKEPTEAFFVHVNMDDVLRIFNNVFTNIDKYADESAPVSVAFKYEKDFVTLAITNKIRQTPRKNESAKIGLISINSLMKRQGGTSFTCTTESTFTIELKFPRF